MVDFKGAKIENNDFADRYDIDFYPTLLLFNWNAVGPFRSGKRNQDVVATGIVL
jgi:hypothetical protein